MDLRLSKMYLLELMNEPICAVYGWFLFLFMFSKPHRCKSDVVDAHLIIQGIFELEAARFRLHYNCRFSTKYLTWDKKTHTQRKNYPWPSNINNRLVFESSSRNSSAWFGSTYGVCETGGYGLNHFRYITYLQKP